MVACVSYDKAGHYYPVPVVFEEFLKEQTAYRVGNVHKELSELHEVSDLSLSIAA